MAALRFVDGGDPWSRVPTPEQVAAYLVSQGLADATVRCYLPLLQRFLDHLVLAEADPAELDPLDVRSWAASLRAGRATLAQAKAVVGHWCEVTDQEDVSGSVPVPRAPQHKVAALSPGDAKLLADHAAGAGARGLAVLVGMYTAARRSEIASLAWPRVDLEGGWITLERVKVRDLHRVPLHPTLAEQLAARMTWRGPWSWERGGTPWVFPGAHGGHVVASTIWTWVKAVAGDAGVDCTPHQLRHTALTWINDATGNLRAAQEYAGHSSPDVTARYTRATELALRSAVDSLDY